MSMRNPDDWSIIYSGAEVAAMSDDEVERLFDHIGTGELAAEKCAIADPVPPETDLLKHHAGEMRPSEAAKRFARFHRRAPRNESRS